MKKFYVSLLAPWRIVMNILITSSLVSRVGPGLKWFLVIRDDTDSRDFQEEFWFIVDSNTTRSVILLVIICR